MADDLNTAVAEDQTILGGEPSQDAPESADVGQGGPTVAGSELPKWTEQLPRDYRDRLAKYESYKDFVVAASDALSDESIRMPKEDAAPEEWDKFWQAAGRPESPDGYEIKEETELAAGFRKTAHDVGLTKQQAEKLYQWYDGALQEEFAAVERQTEEVTSQLKSEWGSDFDSNMKAIKRFAAKYGSDEAQEALRNPAIGNNKALINLFVNAGKELAADVMIEGKSSGRAADQPVNRFNYDSMKDLPVMEE